MKLKDKEILKTLQKIGYTDKGFTDDCKSYIKAIEENRMLCNVANVSSSGTTRILKFSSCEKIKKSKNYYYRNYSTLFRILGFSESKEIGYFRITGCGMDMIFATNYSIIHYLKKIGFIDERTCEILAQKTPTII